MPANPLEALKKASFIGPDWTMDPNIVKRGEMPMPNIGPILGAVGRYAQPAIRALGGLLGGSRGNIARRSAPVMETLGERIPDFTPVGGEAMYNAGRQAPRAMAEPMEGVYQRISQLRGGNQVAPRPSPLEAFYKNNPPASFEASGGRSTGQFPDTDLLSGVPIGLRAIKGLVGR